MKVIFIRWMDAALQSGWTSDHEYARLAKVETIGYCVFEDDKVLKVAINHSDGMFDGIQSIPKSSIISRRNVHLPRK